MGALDGDVLVAPLDSRYTQVGFNLISVQVWLGREATELDKRQQKLITLLWASQTYQIQTFSFPEEIQAHYCTLRKRDLSDFEINIPER